MINTILRMYPDITVNDFSLQDDGEGVYIKHWNWNEPQPNIDDVIAESLIIPLEVKAENVRLALQAAIDIKAKSFGFSGGNALMLYAGFLNPFQPLAQVFATWESSVWVEADTYKQEVIAGNKPMLSGAEAVALMPVYPS